jgi:predicted ThiF/HesA family dinucleotide-utilizing enzyme
MKFDHVYLVGAGGTGTHLADPLVRLMAHHSDGTKNITIIDGDHFEEKNEERQLFDRQFLNQNKAVATVSRIGVPWVKSIADFIDKEKFTKLLHKDNVTNDTMILVIMAVDNAATRRDLLEAVEEFNIDNYVVMSPGNSYDSGQLIVQVRQSGQMLTARIMDKYANIREPEDHIPGTVEGCMAQIPSTPQLIMANAGAAWCAQLTITAMLNDAKWHEELHFNGIRMKMKAQGKPKEFLTPVLQEHQ